jgi:putative addiction module component (TIGR02574 family)
MQKLREQVLRLTEPERAAMLSALLDSLRPPSQCSNSDELAREILKRADGYERGELEAMELDESVKLARQAAQARRPT